ncbi:MAG: SurA N-terminal domain-containing protein [Sphingomonadales bacterium]|nr:SurA N-terminal domain-containing protein [Sphingomonadales bacterium]
MLQFFRNFFGSKLGIAVTLGFVGLIALAFAGGDVASSGSFGGIAGGDRVASVGRERISTSDLERAASNSVEQLREQDPKLTIKTFVAEGGLDQMLGNLIDLAAVRSFGEKYGVYVGNRLVDSEIAKIPAAQGADGKFSDTAYRGFLAQKHVTDDQLRRQITEAMMAREMLSPAEIGLAAPKEAINRYVGVITEKRVGSIALLPSAVFAPKSAPTDAEIAAWYGAHKADYMLPERRVIRYATFTDAAVKNVPAPTDAEIAAIYAKNKALFAASETRKVTQLVVPTEPAAKAIMAELGAGASLEAVAASKGLAAASLGSLTKQALSGQTSQAAADAVFAAGKGKLVGPLKAPLGWTLLRVDAVETKPGKTLDQARGEIVSQLSVAKRRAALTDFSARIEDEFDKGAALSDVTKELGVTIAETPPLLADGSVYGQAGGKAPPQLARVVSAAFAMEREKQPQLAEVEPGKTFVVFDVGTLATAAPPPLADIKQVVATDIQLSKGSVAAKAAAQKVEDSVRKGGDLTAAMHALGLSLPPVQPVDMPRQQLQAMGNQVPPPITMLFQMAKGKVKLMGAPHARGWYVVQLKDVVPGQVQANDPRLSQFAKSIDQLQSSEYSEQLRAAMRNEVGVKRNEAAVAAVRNRLVGTSGSGN